MKIPKQELFYVHCALEKGDIVNQDKLELGGRIIFLTKNGGGHIIAEFGRVLEKLDKRIPPTGKRLTKKEVKEVFNRPQSKWILTDPKASVPTETDGVHFDKSL